MQKSNMEVRRLDTPITRAEHDEFVKRMQDEHKRIHYRITDIEKTVDRIQDLAQSVERLAVSMENMAKEQRSQGERLETLEGRDGEKWRKITGYVATAIIGIVIGFVAYKIGLGGF